ncbi:hypothetical protein Btru_071773 [Bulinus truncatus]|nr:hypothetical protein Btru_071773 [Bulinus truncatus]
MYRLVLILLLADFSDQHSISWMKTSKSPWMCGLVKDRDNVILYSRISMGSQNDVMDRAKFEIKKHNSSYEELCVVDLKDCKGFSSSDCYCKPLTENYVVDVVINMTAAGPESGATMKGSLYSSNNNAHISSDEITLPVVYDISSGEAILSINDKPVNIKQCDITIEGKTAVIVLRRPANINVPYKLKIMEKADGKLIKNSTNALAISVQVDGHRSLTLSYEVSYLLDSVRKFDCNIHSEDECEITKLRSNVFLGLFIFFLIVLIAIVTVVVVLKLKFGLQLVKKKEKKSKNAEELIPLKRTPDYTEVDLSISNERYVMFGNRASVSLKKTQKFRIPFRINYSLLKFLCLSSMFCFLLPTEDRPGTSKRRTGILSILKIGENVERPVDLVKNVLQNYKATKYDIDEPLTRALKSQLTNMVQITVGKTSDKRPLVWPVTYAPYPNYKGDHVARLGLGRIVSVSRFTKENKEESLVWNKLRSKIRSNEWVEVTVWTSRHVVFDDAEAEQTTCTMLTNEDEERRNVTLKGQVVRMINLMENWTLMICTSDDLSLFNVLKENADQFNNDWLKLMENHKQYKLIKGTGFIVSLPREKVDMFKPEANLELSQKRASKELMAESSKEIARASINVDLSEVKEELPKEQDIMKDSKIIKPSEVIEAEDVPMKTDIHTQHVEPITKGKLSKKEKHKESEKQSKKVKSKKEYKAKDKSKGTVAHETKALLLEPSQKEPEEKIKDNTNTEYDEITLDTDVKEAGVVTMETDIQAQNVEPIKKGKLSKKEKQKESVKESKKVKSKKEKYPVKDTSKDSGHHETKALLPEPSQKEPEEKLKDKTKDEPEFNETIRDSANDEPQQNIQSTSKVEAKDTIHVSQQVEQKELIVKPIIADPYEITQESDMVKPKESTLISKPVKQKQTSMGPQRAELKDVIKDMADNRLCHKVNSYNKSDQSAIYIERNSEYYFCAYQKERQLPYNPEGESTYWELAALPLVLRFTD